MRDTFSMRDLKIIQSISFTKSLSKTAQDFHIAQANVSKTLSTLEEKIGLKIFERKTRPLRPTVFGEELITRIDKLLHSREEFISFIENYKSEPSGMVEIHASTGQLMYLTRYVIPDLKENHPELKINFVTRNLKVSEYANGIEFAQKCDILFTHTIPANEDLIAKKIASVKCNIYGSDTFISNNSIKTIDDYSKKACILYFSFIENNTNLWVFENSKTKEKTSIPVTGDFMCDNAQTALELSSAGLGFVFMPEVMIREMGYEGRLHPTLPQNYNANIELYMIYRKRTQQPYRVEVVIDSIAKNIQSILL